MDHAPVPAPPVVPSLAVTTVGFDSETYLIVPGLLAPPPVCFTFAWTTGETVIEDPAPGLVRLRGLLADPSVVLVGHNPWFDLAVACAADSTLVPLVFAALAAGRVRDTALRSQLLDIADGCLAKPNAKTRPYSLAWLMARHFGVDRTEEKTDPDAWRLRYGSLHRTGVGVEFWPAGARNYAIQDAIDALRVYGHLPAQPNEPEQCRAAWALHLMSCWGMRTDRASVERLQAETAAKVAANQERFLAEGLYRYTGSKKNPKISQFKAAIKARVVQAYGRLGEEVPLTDTKQVSTDADCLMQSGDPLLAELSASGPTNSTWSTFLPLLWIGTEHPINTRFRPLLETGRISSSAPNLNNIPREGGVRECFVPRDGHLLCSVDYDVAELRSWAQVQVWLFGRCELADFFRANPDGDPHLDLAAADMGVTYAEAKRLKKAGDARIKELRQGAKPVNFGLPGGMGPARLRQSARQYNVHMTLSEAYDRRQKWRRRWRPERYFDHVSRIVGEGRGAIEQLKPGGGPHRRRGNVGYTEACNTYFQSLTADGAKEALWRVSSECYVDHGTALFGCRPVGFLYDEILTEMPRATAHEVAERQTTLMVQGMEAWLPDIPVLASPALMDRWMKGAEAQYDANGRLVPWTPAVAA